jgi:hypothetical protein
MATIFLQVTRCISLIIAAYAIYFSYRAFEGLFLFVRTQNCTIADKASFAAVVGSWGRYYLEGTFQFDLKGTLYEGKTRLTDSVYINRPYAEEKAAAAAHNKWRVYFDAKNPKWATLERKIPFREIFSAFLLWVSLVYIASLKRKLKAAV